MNDYKQNVKSDAFWLRTLFMVLFFLVYRVIDVVLLLLTVVQWGFRLVTGEPNPALRQFGDSLGVYTQQIIHYLTGVSDEKPYPFMDWPDSK